MLNEEALYLLAVGDKYFLSHVAEEELREAIIDQGISIAGDIFQGRILKQEGPAYWVNIGLEKPALLQKPTFSYKEGDLLVVQLKRPPLEESFLIKNAEVSDKIFFWGPCIQYKVNQKGVHFSPSLQDKKWRQDISQKLEAFLSFEEGVFLTEAVYPKLPFQILEEINVLRQESKTLFHQAKGAPVGILKKALRPWIRYVLDHKTVPFYTTLPDSVLLLKKEGALESSLNFATRPSWRSQVLSLWEDLLEPQVPLKEGGYLLIEEGHTLTAIDVNTTAPGSRDLTSGVKLTGPHKLFEFACHALQQTIHHIYLRKIGGIVLLDLPRLPSHSLQSALLQEAKSYEDNHLQVLGFTKSGLLEITKRKDQPSLKMLLKNNREW